MKTEVHCPVTQTSLLIAVVIFPSPYCLINDSLESWELIRMVKRFRKQMCLGSKDISYRMDTKSDYGPLENVKVEYQIEKQRINDSTKRHIITAWFKICSEMGITLNAIITVCRIDGVRFPKQKWIRPRQAKMFLRIWAKCADSDHLAHAQSIIRAFAPHSYIL